MNKLRNAGGEKWWFFHLVKIHKFFTTAIFSLVITCVQAQSPTLPPDDFVIIGQTFYTGTSNSSSITPPILPPDDFVTTWWTGFTGSSNNSSITVPMVGGPYHVDWNNDGIFDDFGLYFLTVHDFGVPGSYTIRIGGNYDSIRFSDTGDQVKISSVDQWGTNIWKSMENAFSGAQRLTIPATDTPDFGSVTSMRGMFNGASEANPDTSGWDTSSVTDMSVMFSRASLANPDTSGWDTSSVTSMSTMFSFASRANPDTSGWDTSSVTDMHDMFHGAHSANPDTSGWDTSLVTDMSDMFRFATSANPDTSGWDTSSVTSMKSMFDNASSFDQDIGSWDVSALLNAFSMFRGVTLSSFNYEGLLIGWSAQLLNSAVNFDGGNSKHCSLLSIQARNNLTASDSWLITDGGQTCSIESCNMNIVSGEVVNSTVSRESCEILAVGPLFSAQKRANVTLSSGSEVQLLPGFSIEKGAELTVNVCGQSLCMTSDSLMPYGCHPCVNRICDIDPSCCSVEFDSTCVASVFTYCGLLCE